MNAIDTNIIVRFLTKDDPVQYKKATKILKNESAWIPKTVLVETYWVLNNVYKYPKEKVIYAFMQLAGLPNVKLESNTQIKTAMEYVQNGMEFPDAVHLASSQENNLFYTFDIKMIKSAKKSNLLKVQSPK